MAWVSGVVTYSARKPTKDGQGSYGIFSVEGIQMFCAADVLPEKGAEVRCFVQSNTTKRDDGSYSNSLNAVAIQYSMLPQGNSVSLHPVGVGGKG